MTRRTDDPKPRGLLHAVQHRRRPGKPRQSSCTEHGAHHTCDRARVRPGGGDRRRGEHHVTWHRRRQAISRCTHAAPPKTSDMGPPVGGTAASLVVATLTHSGTFNVYNFSSASRTHLIIDVTGWYSRRRPSPSCPRKSCCSRGNWVGALSSPPAPSCALGFDVDLSMVGDNTVPSDSVCPPGRPRDHFRT